MACRAVGGATGDARRPVGAGADERVTTATVGTVGAPTAVGCETGGATKVAGLAKAGGWSESPERKEAWRRFSAVRAAVVDRSWASMAVMRAWHSSSSVWAVARWPCRMESLEMRGAATRSCSAVPRSIAWRSGSVGAHGSADTRVWARPFSTSWREACPTSSRCLWVSVSQTDAQCSRWGGGPPLAVRAVRSMGAVGRSLGVRPVIDPVLAPRSVESMGEKSKSGPDVEGGGDPVLVLIWAAVPEVGLVEGAVDDVVDMVLREARKAARGVKTRGGGSHER